MVYRQTLSQYYSIVTKGASRTVIEFKLRLQQNYNSALIPASFQIQNLANSVNQDGFDAVKMYIVPANGVKGEKGDVGDAGVKGADGVDGKQGAHGSVGIAGVDGVHGRDGTSVDASKVVSSVSLQGNGLVSTKLDGSSTLEQYYLSQD